MLITNISHGLMNGAKVATATSWRSGFPAAAGHRRRHSRHAARWLRSRSVQQAASCCIEPMESRLLLSSVPLVSPPSDAAIGLGPSISVLTPSANGDVVRQPGPYAINWSASDGALFFPTTISLYYDQDNTPGGETPIANASGLSNTGSFVWNIPSSLIGDRVYIKAVASNILGSNYAYSPGILTIRRPSTPPTITLPVSSLQFMGGASPLLVDPQAVVSDADSSNFANGYLTASIDKATQADSLTIRNEGFGPGQIGLRETTVLYGGVPIGVFRGGSGISPLTVMLNQSATVEATQALVRNLQFSSKVDAVGDASRTVHISLSDGAGGISSLISAVIGIIPILLQPTNYAVLFAGGADAGNNHVRYYNNIKDMYQTLVSQYGLQPSNIYVLFADGTNSAADQNPDNGGAAINSNMSFAAGSHVLAATHGNLNTALNQLASQITGFDYFLFYSFDHGGGAFKSTSETSEETLTGWGSSIRDDELSSWLDAIHAAHSTYIHTQCFSGGMQDDIQSIMSVTNDFSAAATNHYEYSWGDGFAHAFAQGLKAGARMTYDAYRYAYLNDPYATAGQGPGGSYADSTEHPWSTGGDFRIFYPASNARPFMLFNNVYASGSIFSPVWFSRGQLAAMTGAIDPNGDLVDFRIDAVNSGTLLMNGSPVVPGVTTMRYGDHLQWIPPSFALGLTPAFTVSASDGLVYSTTSAHISVNIGLFPSLGIFDGGGNSYSGSAGDNAAQIGAVPIGSSAPLARFTLSNPSDKPLEISSFSWGADQQFIIGVLDAAGKPVDFSAGKFVIPSQSALTIQIKFTPQSSGLQQGKITFLTNDPADNGTPRELDFEGFGVDFHAPTLTKVATLTGAFSGQPFTIPQTLLQQSSDAADQDPGTTMRFRIDSVVGGQLTLDGQPVVPGQSILDLGHSLVWIPSPEQLGTLPAFTISAWDGSQASAKPVLVSVRVLQDIHFAGGGDSNYCLVKADPNAGMFQVFNSAAPGAQPIISKPLNLVGSFEFDGGLGSDTLVIGSALPFTPAFHGLAGSDTIIVQGGSYAFPTDLRAETDSLTLAVTGSAAVQLGSTQVLDSLVIGDSARVSLLPDSNSLLLTNSLSIGPFATLDLANNDMIVHNGAMGILIGLLKSGRAGGKWTGHGITSSAAAANRMTTLAMIANQNGQKGPLFQTFDGQPVGTDAVLVKYTWNGDVNLDGIVDAGDYFLVDSGFITQQGGYRNGDLNLDGVVDAGDYFLIDSAFIAQSGPLSASEPEALVVQPAKKAEPDGVLAQLFSTQAIL